MSEVLEELFTSAGQGYNLKALYEFRNPSFDIQPAVIPSDFRWTKDVKDGELSKRGEVLSPTVLTSIKQYIMESRETGNVGKKLNKVIDDKGKIADLTPNAILPSTGEFLINPQLETAVNEAYNSYITKREKTNMGNAPLYIVVFGKVAGGHASIFFYVNATLYSVGLGYLGGKEGKSAERISGILGGQLKANAYLYSPDYLIQPGKGKTVKGHLIPFRYEIADIGLLQPGHLDRIREFLVQAGKEFTIGMEPMQGEDEDESLHRYKFKCYYINLNKTYNMISRKGTATATLNNINCTTFAEVIFRERLTCPIISESLASHPLRCRSKVLGNARETFKAYMKKYIQSGSSLGSLFDQLYSPIADANENNNIAPQSGFFGQCFGGLCRRLGISGGKYKTRRVKKRKGTRRHRKY
jgi:hypothetical protein